MNTPIHTNSLINETSPYLLQHAHNPVNWFPWENSVLEKAKRENSLMIISVGYAACHWCHVMENESFEDTSVAEVMNSNYLNIKVDREERPDVDQAYMNAVQIMTGSGGWPMNVVTLPDGRPVWGGTYFKKEEWISALTQIAKLFKKQPEKLYDYADKLEAGLKQIQLISPKIDEENNFSRKDFDPIINKIEKDFDYKYGGTKQIPKFIIPINFEFLLRYADQNENDNLLNFIFSSLTKISFGGIYDHLEGGFSRYSVDERWHIPHFEKMLYDNAQLISLYSNAYSKSKNSWFKEVVIQTLNFINNNLTVKDNGAFYSSLDADSLDEKNKLKEGAFYIWKKSELKELLANDFTLFRDYYNVNSYGKWEHLDYVLIRTIDDKEFSEIHQLDPIELKNRKLKWQEILLDKRNKRNKPRLDDKQITSWNALMLKAYIDAYNAFSDNTFLKKALKNAKFISETLLQTNGNLHHSAKNGKSKINGYLEDYALTIEAFIELYQVSLDLKWLKTSENLINYCLDHFYDSEKSMFYFTSNEDRPLIIRNIDSTDNVIPSSNSVMAHNLFKLSKYLNSEELLNISKKMMAIMEESAKDYPNGYSNWLNLKINFTHPYYEVVVTGPNAIQIIGELKKQYLPNCIIDGCITQDSRPLTANRYKKNEDLIYVCSNGVCQLPVRTVTECLNLIKHF